MSAPAIPWMGDLLALQARLHRARRRQKITQAQAGAMIGISERTYRDFERGAADISATNLFFLAARVGIRLRADDEDRQDFAGSAAGRGSA